MQLLNKRGAVTSILIVFAAIIGLSVWAGLTEATGILLISIALITYGAFSEPGRYQWKKWLTVLAAFVFSITTFLIDSRQEQIILIICLLTPLVGYAARFLVVDNAKIPALSILVIVFLNLALWVLEFSFPVSFGEFTTGVPMHILKIQTVVAFIGGFIILLEVVSFVSALQKENVHNKESLSWLNLIMNLISHNLRTPLTSASMSQQMLELSVEKDAPSRKQVEAIGSAIEIMDDTINRLIRAGSISDMVTGNANSEVIDQFRKAYPDVEIKVLEQYEVASKLNIAVQLAIEVFVDNALKHGGQEVELCFCSKRVRIWDSGNGLDADQLKQFGKRSTQDSAGTNLHGIGINFALRVLEAVGWSASPRNTEDGFEIFLEPTHATSNNLAGYLSRNS